MLIFWQITSFIGLLALSIAWANWVWESHRPITAPRILGEVVVHGLATPEIEATSQALSLGIAATVSEHYRSVEFIQRVSESLGHKPSDGQIQLLQLQSATQIRPLQLGLASEDEVERLDVTVEFGGAKIDTKGLLALFQRNRPKIGTIPITVSLKEAAEDREFIAFASASFPQNSAYGFQTEAHGSLDQIAKVIGFRFLQAHYATHDPFFAALTGAEFMTFWDVQREAAQMALRLSGGDEGSASMVSEAQAAYDRIALIAERYRKRPNLQRLAAFLAMRANDPVLARAHLKAALDAISETEATQQGNELATAEKRTLANDITNLDLLIANETRRETASTTAATGRSEEIGKALEQVAAANRNAFAAIAVNGLIARFPAQRPPRIGFVGGRPSGPWSNSEQVTIVRAGDGDLGESMRDRTGWTMSVAASIAPETQFFVSIPGSLTFAEINAALSALASLELDVIYSDFGVPVRTSSTLAWKGYNEETLTDLTDFDGAVILAAGNDNTEVPALTLPSNAPAYALVGSLPDDESGKPYSNFGPGVDFVVPGDVYGLTADARLLRQRGTSMSAALFAAAAARLAATAKGSVDGKTLLAAIEATARNVDGKSVPDFEAAALQLGAAAEN
jgi:hypothetical protein